MIELPLPDALNGEALETELAAAGMAGATVAAVGPALRISGIESAQDAAARSVAAAHTGRLLPQQETARVVLDALDQAEDAMRAHVTRGTFTAAQRDAALLLVLRTCIGLVKVTRRRFTRPD